MKFRPALLLLLAFTTTCVAAQSAADLGDNGTNPRKASAW